MADPARGARSGADLLRPRSAPAADRSVRPPDTHWLWMLSGDCTDRGGTAWRQHGDRAVSRRASGWTARPPPDRLRFAATGTATKDPLFAAIPNRRSTKPPFDPARPVGQTV